MSLTAILGYDAADSLYEIALDMRMQKLLIITLGMATLILSGCAKDRIADRISERLPWVYKIDVQQGNVITQEMVNQLRLGMEPRQVQFILGTPMITDPFHQGRWDYPYSFEPGGKKGEISQMSVFFESGKLATIQGAMQPMPQEAQQLPASRQQTVTVPYQEKKKPGLLTRLWRWITFGGDKNG